MSEAQKQRANAPISREVDKEFMEDLGWTVSDDKLSTHPEGNAVMVYVKNVPDHKYVAMHIPKTTYISITVDIIKEDRRLYVFQGRCPYKEDFNKIFSLIEIK